MIAAGMEAILIKVAGIGLTTEHLGKSLSEMQPTLTRLVRGASFRVHRQKLMGLQ
jgi:diphthamide synthase (EF-2-diphthine--ammonia ligase)